MYGTEMKKRARELRGSMTREERHLWYDFLRDHPARFLRQHPIERYILDFYCPAARLAIELDGSQHFEPEVAAYDARRTELLNRYGITMLRFPNNDVMQRFEGVCMVIDQEVQHKISKQSTF